jgi:hypothetical protein
MELTPLHEAAISDVNSLPVVQNLGEVSTLKQTRRKNIMDDMVRRDFLVLGGGLFAGLKGITAGGMNLRPGRPGAAEAQQQAVPIRLNVRNKLLHFQSNWCEIPDWSLSIEADHEFLQTTEARVEIVREEPLNVRFHLKRQLTWEIQAETEPARNRLILHSTIRNDSQKPVALGKAVLLHSDKVTGFSRPGDHVVYLPMSSGQGLNQVRALNAKPAASDIAIQAFNQNQNKALQAGFVTFLRAKTQIEHEYSPAKGLQLKAWCEFDGWELQPESSTPTETLTIAVGEDPHAQLEGWGDIAARACHIRAREWEDEPNGWVGWSWVDSMYVERYEDIVLRNARSIRQRLAGFGINYIWVSIGNLKDGQPGDWLSWNYRYFPNGHKYLHDELEQLGIKWGLWCGAFMLSSKLEDKVKELWGALFKQPDGKQPMVYMPAWGYGLDSPTEDYRKAVFALDPSHPKTLEFLRKVFQTYRDWGVRYYMIDFLSAGADTLTDIPHAKHYDKTLVSGPEVFQRGLQAIRDACGDDTYLLASSGQTYHAAGAMDSVRVGNDFGEGRSISIGFETYPASFALKPPSHWNGPVHALTNQAATYYTHRRLYINNSGNVLTIDKPMQLNQAQVNATIHVMSGGPSMLGDDITYIEEDRLSLIKKTLPRPKNIAVPVDLFTRKEQGYPRIYHRKVAKSFGSYDVVAVYNLETTQSIKQGLDLKSIGLDENRTYHVWEFWNIEYVGKVRSRLSVEIPPLSVKVYRLTEDTGQPVILGTDMHVLMGEMEIDRCEWDATQKAFSGRAIRPVGESGSVYIYGPPKMGMVKPKGYYLAKDIENDWLVIRCPLRFEEGWAEWNVKFFDLTFSAPPSPPF